MYANWKEYAVMEQERKQRMREADQERMARIASGRLTRRIPAIDALAALLTTVLTSLHIG